MAKTFYVNANGKSLRVVVLNNTEAVVEKWEKLFGKASMGEVSADAFFNQPSIKNEGSFGAIYLPKNSPRLIELAIHEATHAAIAHVKMMGAEALDATAEEHIATLSGMLASRVVAKLINI